MLNSTIKETTDILRRHLALWSSSSAVEEVPPPQLGNELLELAEAALDSGHALTVPPEIWHEYLYLTSRPRFLLSLPSAAHRERWAETTFSLVKIADYGLLDLFNQRLRIHPDRPLFQETDESGSRLWSYEAMARRIQTMAAAFYAVQPKGPRVAIFANNSLDTACCDLACLCYDIFVSPLIVHFDSATLAWIFDRLGINIVVTDSGEYRERLLPARKASSQPFHVFLLGTDGAVEHHESLFAETCAALGPEDSARILEKRPRRPIEADATVMFTSGSTGKPKGIVFSEYNLITKRFARGAAVPGIGDNDVLLCYLPLYHTFGRYLELLGSVYWGATYAFAGNPSAETLLARMQQVQPSVMIGVPFRWSQIRDYCLEKMGQAATLGEHEALFRRTVGERLQWGLSAAGYLEPKVFQFFNRHGVNLCSGFGMTEATGGITMTPPGGYVDNSVGIPLPGVKTRFGDQGELQVAGPYVARYLDDPCVEQPQPNECGEYWLATGDLFVVKPNGHYEIVDRIKDIYKNNKGQTIAPRRIEQRFEGVPGIKRTFLVGDGRGFNVLLIVPDPRDPVLEASPSEENTREYFHQIVSAVNQNVAPFERVLNFAVLDRDFSLEKGELTAKGSFRRKIIQEHFAQVIDELYRKIEIELEVNSYRVRIPRWLYRDLGILEDDIVVRDGALCNRRLDHRLSIGPVEYSENVLIGDLEYQLSGQEIDLGLFCRQPRLWVSNPALTRFCPCREGWDLPLKGVTAHVFLPWERAQTPDTAESDLHLVVDTRLKQIHQLGMQALFGRGETCREAVERLAGILSQSDHRHSGVIKRRLEALARHADIEVRSFAYRALLLDEPAADYSEGFPAFIHSGLPFLTQDAIQSIAKANLEPRRLGSLRQRLHTYRQQISWPAGPLAREQFSNLLRLLLNFAQYHPESYSAIREELACWALHRQDPEIARIAEQYLEELAGWCKGRFAGQPAKGPSWEEMVVFEDGLSNGEIALLKHVLFGTTMLQQSVMIIFDEPGFETSQVPAGGIWITRVVARHQYVRYRVSLNLLNGKHFDVQLILREDFDNVAVREMVLWMMGVGGFAWGPSALPKFGCCRPELGAMSMAYISDLTVWERIREFTSIRPPRSTYLGVRDWRKLYIRALSTVFRGWRNSDFRIVPGAITPANIVVTEPDFRHGSCVLSLTGWTPYENPLSLVDPMVHNFYQYTTAHYPWSKEYLDLEWIFDACVEALGTTQAKDFLGKLDRELHRHPVDSFTRNLQAALARFRDRLDDGYHVPLSVDCAIDRFKEWQSATPEATSEAREQTLTELQRLYRLEHAPEIARYHLYRHTYFAGAPDRVGEAFDGLLQQMFRNPRLTATQMPELSDLQAALNDAEDRSVFSRMVFPRPKEGHRMEVVSVGESENRQVIVRSQIVDKRNMIYTVREPLEAAEIGQIYRLFFKADFPKIVSELDQFFVCTDGEGQIVGGVCYQRLDDQVAHLDGVVVSQALKGRGIGSALLDDFCVRMASQNAKLVRTHFFLRQFCLPRGFQVDKRWGGLVRFLSSPESLTDDEALE